MDPEEPIPRRPFLLNGDSRTQPTRFKCTFTLSRTTELSGNGQGRKEVQPVYTYGFKYTKKEICEEWLCQEADEEEQDDQLLFRRITANNKITLEVNDSQLSGDNQGIKEFTRSNSLFLSAAAQSNHPQLLKFYEYFPNIIFIKEPESITEFSIADRFSDFQDQEKIKDIIKQADIGITDVSAREVNFSEDQAEIMNKIIELKSIKRLEFSHSTADGKPAILKYHLESRGTQVFLTLLLPALYALSEGSVLVIDELDTSLHPDLSRSLLSLFSRETSTPMAPSSCSQLMMLRCRTVTFCNGTRSGSWIRTPMVPHA